MICVVHGGTCAFQFAECKPVTVPDADEASPEVILLSKVLKTITEVRVLLQRYLDQLQETGSADVSVSVPQLDDT